MLVRCQRPVNCTAYCISICANASLEPPAAGCRPERTLMAKGGGGGEHTPSVFSHRFSVAKGGLDRTYSAAPRPTSRRGVDVAPVFFEERRVQPKTRERGVGGCLRLHTPRAFPSRGERRTKGVKMRSPLTLDRRERTGARELMLVLTTVRAIHARAYYRQRHHRVPRVLPARSRRDVDAQFAGVKTSR